MRSLRGRLTLGVVLVLAAVLAVAGTTAARYVDRSEREAFDDRLKRTAELSRETALASVDQEVPGNDRRLDAVLEATGTSLRVLLADRPILETGAPPPKRPKPVDGLRTFTADGVRYRTYTVDLQNEDLGGLAQLEVTSRLTLVEERQRDLERRLLLLGGGALLVAGLGAFLATGVILRPLRRLRGVARTVVGQEDLSRRVPTTGPTETRALAASLNDMLARLGASAEDRERALEATRRFAADAGHELRTPLTSVKATLSALSRHPDAPAEQRQALLEDALSEHDRLVTLLDGLQALARGDATAADLADIDLAEIADVVLQGAAARHPDVHWSIELPSDPVVVRGWEPGLRLLVDNLVENAARHGREGGTIAVTVAHEDGDVVLRVEDDGPGIPEAEQERIFTPFTRLDGTRGPGSGLGLAIVAQQVRHHGATIRVGRSERLGGAAFRVSLRPGRPGSDG